MNTNAKTNLTNVFNVLNVSFDVGKNKLNYYLVGDESRADSIFEGEFRNSLPIISEKLEEIKKIAKNYGFNKVCVICEPTGGYQNKLLRTARKLGCYTNYVNGESVAKFRIVETNDTGKTDTKDPKIIHTLGRLGKVLTHRVLDSEFLILRKLNSDYESIEKRYVRQKCKIHHCIKELFCDYGFKKDFLYNVSGRALMKAYSLNPFKITERGKQYFVNRMKRNVTRIQARTLNRIWEDANSSIMNELPQAYIECLERSLQREWDQFLAFEKQREEVKDEMLNQLKKLRKKRKEIPPEIKGLITEFHVARIIAETGPLDDFKKINQLYRYAGLNIRQYSSCQMKGNDRVCKKGRPLLRKALSQIILSTTRRIRFYGEYYHKKKETGVKGNKIMVNLMRKFLKTFFGIYKSGGVYDENRVFVCESQPIQRA